MGDTDLSVTDYRVEDMLVAPIGGTQSGELPDPVGIGAARAGSGMVIEAAHTDSGVEIDADSEVEVEAAGTGAGVEIGAATASVPAPPMRDPYDLNIVKQMIAEDKWNDLETYLYKYMPVVNGQSPVLVHSGLILHCRVGQLKTLEAEDMYAYYHYHIKPLADTETTFTDPAKVKNAVKLIGDLLSEQKHIEHLEANLAKKIDNYMMFYFPEEIGYEHPKSRRSPYWRFLSVEDGIQGGRLITCLLCEQVVSISHKSVKSTVQQHLKTCQGLTQRATEMFQSMATHNEVAPLQLPTDTSADNDRAKRARLAPVVGHLQTLKGYAASAVKYMVELGLIYFSKGREETGFESMVISLSGFLFGVSKYGTLAHTDASFSESLQYLLKNDIVDVAVDAQSKLTAFGVSYFSPARDKTKFDEVSKLVFKIHYSATLTEMHVPASLVPASDDTAAILNRLPELQTGVHVQVQSTNAEASDNRSNTQSPDITVPPFESRLQHTELEATHQHLCLHTAVSSQDTQRRVTAAGEIMSEGNLRSPQAGPVL